MLYSNRKRPQKRRVDCVFLYEIVGRKGPTYYFRPDANLLPCRVRKNLGWRHGNQRKSVPSNTWSCVSDAWPGMVIDFSRRSPNSQKEQERFLGGCTLRGYRRSGGHRSERDPCSAPSQSTSAVITRYAHALRKPCCKVCESESCQKHFSRKETASARWRGLSLLVVESQAKAPKSEDLSGHWLIEVEIGTPLSAAARCDDENICERRNDLVARIGR